MKPLELPGPQDLLVLPRAMDKRVQVFLKDSLVTVRGPGLEKQRQLFARYPNIDPQVDEDGDLVLHPVPHRPALVLFTWPNGLSRGVLAWPGGYYSELSEDTGANLIGAGFPARVIECPPSQAFAEALTHHLP